MRKLLQYFTDFVEVKCDKNNKTGGTKVAVRERAGGTVQPFMSQGCLRMVVPWYDLALSRFSHVYTSTSACAELSYTLVMAAPV